MPGLERVPGIFFHKIPPVDIPDGVSGDAAPAQVSDVHGTRQDAFGKLFHREIKRSAQIDPLNVGGGNTAKVSCDWFTAGIPDCFPGCLHVPGIPGHDAVRQEAQC